MPFLNDSAQDALLNEVGDNSDELTVCSSEPTDYTEAYTTYKLGSKANPSFTGPAAGDVSGRKITCDAISDGSITGDGTVSYWSLVNTTSGDLLAAGSLSTSASVSSGAIFTLAAFDIEVTDPS